MKRIWFTQQKQFDYISLRWGLGYITEDEAKEAIDSVPHMCGDEPPSLGPKIYTTCTHRLSGDYYVVEGSRFKAKPVEPRIEFTAHPVAIIQFSDRPSIVWQSFHDQLPLKLPELDLGITGVTFRQLQDEVFRRNRNITADTVFSINKLERINNG